MTFKLNAAALIRRFEGCIEAQDQMDAALGLPPADVVLDMWCSGFVNRWHTNADSRLRDSRDLTCGHAQRVAVLYLLLFCRDDGDPWEMLDGLVLCLLHDAPEVFTGDMSYEAKRHMPSLHVALHESEAAWFEAMRVRGMPAWLHVGARDKVALCDWLDAYLYARSVAPDLLERADWRAQRDLYVNKAHALGVGPLIEEMTA